MSQNKTVIPGLEPSDANYGQGGSSSNFYSRNSQPASRGTVIPGMGTNAPEKPADNRPQQRSANPTGKPVVGFLYSVSRTPAGEFWPLHIGQNTIGKAPSCDICLKEGTVSTDHAVLVVRKMKNPEKVIASISDARSTNGTMLNGQSLGFSAEECKNGDIITIGDNYELFLILIDAATLGLKVQEGFIPVETADEEEVFDDGPEPFFPGSQRPTRAGTGFDPYDFNPAAGGTVGLDGSNPYSDKGGTVGL
jgi:pSer/pThr/pTyr-binding forkhead associated (FHA) protein